MALKLTRGNINGYFNDAAILDFLKSKLDLLHGSVLDIGCGKMRYKNTILSNKNVASYTGLDLEPGKFGYDSKANIYWDGIRMPINDSMYDGAILFEVLEHCPDPRIVVSEAYRTLKPGGILLFSTPFLFQLHGTPHDYQRLSPYGIQKLFADAGFSKITLAPSGSWDASLGQMMAIWISQRPMPKLIRKILRAAFVPVFKLLIVTDRKRQKRDFSENDIMPGILGIAQK